jgi:hypothetical protein
MRIALRALCVLWLTVTAVPASAQTVGVRGFGTLGAVTFTAKDSFDAILGQPTGVIFGGGGQVLLPFGIFVQVGLSHFRQDGERVFIGPNDDVFRLGIPVQLTITPVDLTGGLRFGKWRRAAVYVGGGYSIYRYQETSDFADPSDNVDERFTGFHVMGGAEYLPKRWLAIGGEVAWATVPDALGQSGVSAAFGEDNLGGTTIRLKISVGR